MDDLEVIKKLDELIAWKPPSQFTVPLDWLKAAIKASPASVGTALAILYRSQLRGKTELKLGRSHFKEFGISTGQAHRALQALAKAGLISLETGRGIRPLVRILSVPNESGENGSAK